MSHDDDTTWAVQGHRPVGDAPAEMIARIRALIAERDAAELRASNELLLRRCQASETRAREVRARAEVAERDRAALIRERDALIETIRETQAERAALHATIAALLREASNPADEDRVAEMHRIANQRAEP